MVIVLNLIVIIEHVSHRRHINNTYHVMSGRPFRGEQRQQLVNEVTLITNDLTPPYHQDLLPICSVPNEPLIYGQCAPLTNAGNLKPKICQD